MPRFRETDYILLRFNKLDHFSITDTDYNVTVTHKVYEKLTNDNGKEYGQWIENKLEESHTDTNNRVYEKECIVIEMKLDMTYAVMYENPRIQCFYLHQKENIIGRLHEGDLGQTGVSGIVNCDFIHEIDLDLPVE